MAAFLADLRLAIRTLRRTPAFTTTAIVTLGVAMTLSTTVMTVVTAYLWRDLPYPGSPRLYSVRYNAPGHDEPANMERLDWASVSDVVDQPIAWDLDMFYVLGQGNAESVPGAWVTAGFVEGLGIKPAFGRGFDARAFDSGGVNVALISHHLWQTRFHGDPSVVGQSFAAYVSDRPDEAERYTVIGVLPERFWHVNPYTDILVPLRARTRTFQSAIEETRSRPAFLASLLAGFGMIAAAVALVGVYGLMAYSVREREREIAVRIAVGADARRITCLCAREGWTVLAGGLAIGGAAAVGVGRLLESQLFGVRPADPMSIAAAAVAYAAAGALAVWWPARRAASVDPATTLRGS